MALPLEFPLHAPPGSFSHIFTLVGVFIFAMSGAVAAIRRQADIFGVLVLAVTASLFGGIFRDVLLGSLPPDNVKSWDYLVAAGLAAIFTFYFYPVANRLTNPVEIFDAVGLGVFSVLGTQKALLFGINAPWAIALGIITGVGGGVARDILMGQMPIILRAEIYATAAMLGSTVVAALYHLTGLDARYSLLIGATLCSAIRLLAIHYRWHINIAPPTE